MKIACINFIALLLICSTKIIVAQSDTTLFYSNYNSPLPNNNVTDIIISKDGKTKWIATWGGGITKFTGKNWQTFNTKNSAISSDFINEIKQDKLNNIWLATNQKGVDKFDGKKFTNYSIGQTNTILSIAVGKDENIFVGTYNEGLYEIKNNTVIKIWGGEDALKYAIQAICFDNKNTIWISTGKGIYYSSDKIHFQKMIIDSTQKRQKVNFGIAADSKGNVWCATFPNGTLQKWNGKSWEIFEESATKFLKDKSSNPSKEYFKHAFYIDKNDNVYLSSQRNSLMRFDGLNWISLTDKQQNKSVIAAVAVDTSGNIFSGSWGNGMMQLHPQPTNNFSATEISKLINRKVTDVSFVTTKSTKSTIAVYDHGIVDGDEISLYVNDILMIEHYTLTAEKKVFEINLQPHSENRIVLVAHNVGTQPPNTTSLILTLDGKSKRYDLNNDLKKSVAIVVKTD
ncbi:MAG: hypothetical protein RL708_1180 [Bacteroidota bacterium]|jgi:ligand-binding sensor domain-containing protein